jgi:rubrerythrin
MAVHPDILEALTSGIQSEVASYVFYIEAAKKMERGEMRKTLEELALEEKKHFHVLERQYDSLIRSEKWISTADVLKEKGLPEIGEDMTAQHRGLIDEVNRAPGIREILDIALRLEYEARNLFAKSRDIADTKEARETFDYLSRFEQTHVDRISGLIARLG